MATDATSMKSTTSSKPRTPGVDGAGKKVGFARPTLIIPPPQASYGPYTAGAYSSGPYTPGSVHTIGSYGAPKPGMYGRKASMFMNRQFVGIRDFTMSTAKSGMGIGEKCSYWCYGKIKHLSRKWFTHCFLSIVLSLYTVGGALLFVYIEGHNEVQLKDKDLHDDKYRLIRILRNLSITLPDKKSEGEWEGRASGLVKEYEDKIIEYYQNYALIMANRGTKIWTLWNAIVYCATVYTTLGYGHIYPTTQTGRALTIVYAIIGIPLFLIALTDFGKLFTRAIKFLWSFVRRVYYTGSCRNVRKSAQVTEIFKGAQFMYEIATFRRPSNVSNEDQQPDKPADGGTPATATIHSEDNPTTPDLSNFEIDDEFNLPISVALFILVAYMFIGAVIYCAWEKWQFFESFYFVFISLSTIGFGDYIPRNPICMIVSIVYLVFGLALMSMCINVVQVKLSDTFQQASVKLSSTMGFEVTEEEMEIENGVQPEDGGEEKLDAVTEETGNNKVDDVPKISDENEKKPGNEPFSYGLIVPKLEEQT